MAFKRGLFNIALRMTIAFAIVKTRRSRQRFDQSQPPALDPYTFDTLVTVLSNKGNSAGNLFKVWLQSEQPTSAAVFD